MIRKIFMYVSLVLLYACDTGEDTIEYPLTAVNFSLSSSLVAPKEEVTITNLSYNAESYKWYIDDVYQSEYFNLFEPSFVFPKSGTYEIILDVISHSGKLYSISKEVRVGNLVVTNLILEKILKRENNWDPETDDSEGYPDVIFKRKIANNVLYESPIYKNVNKLPLEINIDNKFKYYSAYIPVVEFWFYDKDDDSEEAMNKNSYLFNKIEYDSETKKGKYIVSSGWIEFTIKYKIE